MTFDQIPADAQFVSHSGEHFARIDRTEHEQVAHRAEAFGVFDAKGRELGYRYTIDREVWVVDAKSDAFYEIERIKKLQGRLGETFRVMPHALRDGRSFGALPVASYKRFRTLAEAVAYGDAAIARAAKKAK